jgi:hypothetical protein
LGESVGDGVVSADPVEEHLSAFAETISELFPVVR